MSISYLLQALISVLLLVLLFVPIFEKYNQIDNKVYKTCQYVFDRVIPGSQNLLEWLHYCRKESRARYLESDNLKKKLELGNSILSELKLSHLELFSEEESQAIWTDTDKENGLDSKFMDGELVITRIYPNSEAKNKGLQMGDRVFLSESESMSSYDLNRFKGKLKILRRSTQFEISMEPKILKVHREIGIRDIQGVKVITIESFKSQYFSDEKLAALKSKIFEKDNLVIDLRGNNGGNFIAGLRLLSAFICEPTIVGYMKKNKSLGRLGYFEDNLDDEYQIQTLNKYDSVALKTFATNHCLPRPRGILIDAHSKSTAEWVALAFKELLQTPINGAASSGELLVGIWYDISPIWGSVVKLSIPEAYYESLGGRQIEGRGVSVDRNLYPKRADFENGHDSEILQLSKIITNPASWIE